MCGCDQFSPAQMWKFPSCIHLFWAQIDTVQNNAKESVNACFEVIVWSGLQMNYCQEKLMLSEVRVCWSGQARFMSSSQGQDI